MLIIYGDYRDLNYVGDYDASGSEHISVEEKEELRPIWEKFINGQLNLTKGRIKNEEYLEFPKIFIRHRVFEKNEYTTYSIVGGHSKGGSVYVEHCKGYKNRFVDREQGVLVLEKISAERQFPTSLEEIKAREIAFHKEVLRRMSTGKYPDIELNEEDRKEMVKSFEIGKRTQMDAIDRWLNKTAMRWFY